MNELDYMAGIVADTSRRIDASYGPEVSPEARMYRRTTNKLSEEVGEVSLAVSGMLGENPRKGVTHTLDDVLTELLDVASCALGGFEHLTGNRGRSVEALRDRLQFTNARLRNGVES